MPRRAETRKRRTSGAVVSMDMGEAMRGGRAYGPGRNAGAAGRGEAPVDAALPPASPPSAFRSTAPELSASCVRAGFPPAPRPGRV